MEYKLEDLEKRYELELDRIVEEIGKDRVKSVLLQLPDGLKPWGPVLVDYISGECDVGVMIWLGDCRF